MMDDTEVTFLFQFGSCRDVVALPTGALNLKSLKDKACEFINTKVPDNGMSHLPERLLLFRHDYRSTNVLQLVNSAADVVDQTLIEIVLTANPTTYSNNDDIPLIRPHTLMVHSYKAPAFCDFCGEMLFGLVRQGLKCDGCNQNYHKRCVVKVPNNCSRVSSSSSNIGGTNSGNNAHHSNNSRPTINIHGSHQLRSAGVSNSAENASLITLDEQPNQGSSLVRKMAQLMNDIRN